MAQQSYSYRTLSIEVNIVAIDIQGWSKRAPLTGTNCNERKDFIKRQGFQTGRSQIAVAHFDACNV